MTKENHDNSDTESNPSPDADPTNRNQRPEPRFGSFDDNDDDTYEEPDRDTDYASGYRSDSETEDADFEDSFSDDEEDDLFPQEEYDEEPESEPELLVEEQPDDWLDEDGYIDEDETSGPSFPFGLVAVGIVALILLAAGGYGVMQERSATQEELRQLRATLATTSSPENTSTSREALAEMKQAHEKLALEAEALTLENRRLTDTIAGLQAQLGAQQAVLTKTMPDDANQAKPQNEVAALYDETQTPPTAKKATSPKPTTAKSTAPKSPAKPPVAPASSDGWFVNFGSYTSRTIAKNWSTKLRPVAGKVIVAQSTKDGTTYYRVRVIGLDSKSAAEKVARQLEAELQVDRLWIGKE